MLPNAPTALAQQHGQVASSSRVRARQRALNERMGGIRGQKYHRLVICKRWCALCNTREPEDNNWPECAATSGRSSCEGPGRQEASSGFQQPKRQQAGELSHVVVFPFRLNHRVKALRVGTSHNQAGESRIQSKSAGLWRCARMLLPSALINNSHQRENERKEKGRGGGGTEGGNLRGGHEAKGEQGEPRGLRGEKAEDVKMERARQRQQQQPAPCSATAL